MPASALAMVLVAALLHALWNLAAKQAGGNHHFAFISGAMVVLLWAPAALWFGWRELPLWGPQAWLTVLASAVVHLLYFNVLLAGYRKADLTVVYPVARGSGPLLSVCGAWLWLGEALTWRGALGALMVCAGVFLVAGGPGLWRNAHDPAQRQRTRAGVRWGLFTGAFIAGYSVIDAYAIKLLLVSPVLLDYFGNLLRLPLLLPAALRQRQALRAAWRSQWRQAAVVATLGPLGYVLVLFAVQRAPLSHVAPARELSMLFAALIGARLLGEGDRLLRAAGATCIAAGVVALAVA